MMDRSTYLPLSTAAAGWREPERIHVRCMGCGSGFTPRPTAQEGFRCGRCQMKDQPQNAAKEPAK